MRQGDAPWRLGGKTRTGSSMKYMRVNGAGRTSSWTNIIYEWWRPLSYNRFRNIKEDISHIYIPEPIILQWSQSFRNSVCSYACRLGSIDSNALRRSFGCSSSPSVTNLPAGITHTELQGRGNDVKNDVNVLSFPFVPRFWPRNKWEGKDITWLHGCAKGMRHDTLGDEPRTGSWRNTWEWMELAGPAHEQTLFMNDCDHCHIIG